MAVATFVAVIPALFGSDANTTQQISGIIILLGAVVAYIAGEGRWTDRQWERIKAKRGRRITFRCPLF